MTRKKKQLHEQQEQEYPQEQREQEQIVCVTCKISWHITEFDKVIDKNPMCVVCSTIIGANQ